MVPAVQPPPLAPPVAPAWARVTSFCAGGGEGVSGGWGELCSPHPPGLIPPLRHVPADPYLAVRGEGAGGEAGGGVFHSLPGGRDGPHPQRHPRYLPPASRPLPARSPPL